MFSERRFMGESASTPAFEVRSLKSASGWYVPLGWPDGKRDHISGFTITLERKRDDLVHKGPPSIAGATASTFQRIGRSRSAFKARQDLQSW
jgi:hypothetical protein